MLSIFSRAEQAHAASGASLYGDQLARWPAWAVDALVTIQMASVREHNSRVEAQISEIPKQ